MTTTIYYTDKNGKAEITFSESATSLDLTLEKSGYITEEVTVANPKEVSSLDIVMKTTVELPSFTVTVTDEGGNPIQNVKITVEET